MGGGGVEDSGESGRADIAVVQDDVGIFGMLCRDQEDAHHKGVYV